MDQRRVAVVTGGSAGVGRAVCIELAQHGWDVAVLARGQAGLAGVLADIEQAGARGLAIGADVADLAQVRSAAEKVESDPRPHTALGQCRVRRRASVFLGHP